jgi:hypothetical protein
MGQVCTQHTHQRSTKHSTKGCALLSKGLDQKLSKNGPTWDNKLEIQPKNLPNSTDSNDSRVHFPPFSVQKWPSRYPYHWRRPCRNPAAWLSKCQMGAAVFDVSFNKKVLVLLICFAK